MTISTFIRLGLVAVTAAAGLAAAASPVDSGLPLAKKGSFDITKKGSFDITKKGSFDITA